MTGSFLFLAISVVAAAALLVVVRELHQKGVFVWLPAYLRGDWRAPGGTSGVTHVMFCFVDHYEPHWGRPALEKARERVAVWRKRYPELCAGHRDADGRPPIHTFFFPEEEYRPEHIDPLVDLCRLGMGEIEVHLHHDNDTDAGLREKLRRFTRCLVDDHDALPVDPATGQPRWAFIHGNWALDNSRRDGRWCGVNNELVVLREEGCYADYTLPSAPSDTQTSTINSIYYATDDVCQPKSHDTGVRVRAGGRPEGDLMIIQGPLGFMWHRRKFGLLPRIETSDVQSGNPPDEARVDGWVRKGIHVAGRPQWVFVKVHTHGAPDHDHETLLGGPASRMFSHLESAYNDGQRYSLHYVSAREMYNIVKAAEAGKTGNPGEYRDFIVPRPAYRPRAERAGN